ncbi:hypothetical protein [Streptomyces sp. NPDC002845]
MTGTITAACPPARLPAAWRRALRTPAALRGTRPGEAVELAAAGADPDTLVRALPPQAAGAVGLAGDLDTVRTRLDAYAKAGLDEIALVPATAADPGGERTLTGLAEVLGSG